MLRFFGNSRGQQIIEWILMVTALTVVTLYFVSSNGPMRAGVNRVMDFPKNMIQGENSMIKIPE